MEKVAKEIVSDVEILQKYDKRREYKVVKSFGENTYSVMIKSKSGNAMTMVATGFKKPEDALKKYPDAEITNIKLRKSGEMDNKKVARELLKIAKELVAGTDEVFVVKQGSTYTLWSAYMPNSGTTAVFRGKIKSYITDKQGDKNHDSIVRAIAKNFPDGEIIETGIYEYTSSHRDYDIYGGSIKPMKKLYIVIKKEQNYHIVSFFTSKNEARYWIKQGE